MDSSWSRRGLLSLLGTGLVSGCLQFSRAPESATTPQTQGQASNSQGTLTQSSGDSSPESSPEQNAVTGEVSWPFEMRAPGATRPIVHDGTVYIGSVDHNVYAIDAATGTSEFSTDVGDEIGPGLEVASGTLYGATTEGIFGVDMSTGELVLDVTLDIGYGDAPLAHDQSLYYPGDPLIALDRQTGEVLWEQEGNSLFGGQPAVVDNILIASDAGETDTFPSDISTVYGLNPADGTIQWEKNIEQDGLLSPVGVSAEQGIAVLAGRYGMLAAFDTNSGRELWRTTIEKRGNVPFIPIVDGTTVYLPMNNDGLRAFDVSSGNKLWHQEASMGSQLNIIDNRIVTSSTRTTYEVSSSNGEIRSEYQLSPERARGFEMGTTPTTQFVYYATGSATVARTSRDV